MSFREHSEPVINVHERWRDRASLRAFRDEGPADDQTSALTAIDVDEYPASPSGSDT